MLKLEKHEDASPIDAFDLNMPLKVNNVSLEKAVSNRMTMINKLIDSHIEYVKLENANIDEESIIRCRKYLTTRLKDRVRELAYEMFSSRIYYPNYYDDIKVPLSITSLYEEVRMAKGSCLNDEEVLETLILNPKVKPREKITVNLTVTLYEDKLDFILDSIDDNCIAITKVEKEL